MLAADLRVAVLREVVGDVGVLLLLVGLVAEREHEAEAADGVVSGRSVVSGRLPSGSSAGRSLARETQCHRVLAALSPTLKRSCQSTPLPDLTRGNTIALLYVQVRCLTAIRLMLLGTIEYQNHMGFSSVQIEKEVDPGENVLILSPGVEANDAPICMDLLTVESPVEEAILSVTVAKSPDSRVQIWKQYVDSPPAATKFIDVDTAARSACSCSPAEDHFQCEALSLETVASPSNLTKLGIEISNAVDELASVDEDRQLVVCFHSLTPLLQYVSDKALFRFIHLVSSEFSRADAVAHFHMDPTVHDRDTLSTFLPLFDVVIEYEDGEWTLEPDRESPT